MSNDDPKDFDPTEAKVVFAEGFFEALDAMEMPVEEQQKLLDELKAAIDSGEFFKNARPITEEEYEELVEEGILPALDDDDVGSKPPTIN